MELVDHQLIEAWRLKGRQRREGRLQNAPGGLEVALAGAGVAAVEPRALLTAWKSVHEH